MSKDTADGLGFLGSDEGKLLIMVAYLPNIS